VWCRRAAVLVRQQACIRYALRMSASGQLVQLFGPPRPLVPAAAEQKTALELVEQSVVRCSVRAGASEHCRVGKHESLANANVKRATAVHV